MISFLIKRNPCVLYFAIDLRAGFNMFYIEQIHIFPHGLLHIVDEPHKAQSAQAAVHQKIDIAFFICCAFPIRAEKHRPTNAITGKMGANIS